MTDEEDDVFDETDAVKDLDEDDEEDECDA